MGPLSHRGGRFLLGEPYVAAGRLFIPRDELDYDRYGVASVTASEHRGRPTANGERIDPRALTGAHPTLPLPSYAEITNAETGCMVVVRLNDRGPFVSGRIVQVSARAATLLGFGGRGLADVRVRLLGPAPLNGDPSYEEYFLVRFPDRGCLASTRRRALAHHPGLGLEPGE